MSMPEVRAFQAEGKQEVQRSCGASVPESQTSWSTGTKGKSGRQPGERDEDRGRAGP